MNGPSPRGVRGGLLALGLGFGLACGGLPVEPEPAALPAMLAPVPDGDGCTVKNLATDEVLARFDGACSNWTVAVSPKDASDVLITMREGDGTVARRGDQTLPEAETGSVDAVGFDAEGRVVMFTDVSIDEELKHDARKNVSYTVADGVRLEVPYEEERMFGVSLCRFFALQDGAWTKAADPVLVELHEGMSSPWCSGAEGAPELAPILQPGQDEAAPGELSDLEPVPDGLKAIPHDEENSWQQLADLDLAVSVMWFEGARLNEPVVFHDGETWRALEGFGEERAYARPVQLFLRGDHLLVCTTDEAHLYQRSLGYRRVWHATGQCPVFWPLA